jgi:hypothetical protein
MVCGVRQVGFVRQVRETREAGSVRHVRQGGEARTSPPLCGRKVRVRSSNSCGAGSRAATTSGPCLHCGSGGSEGRRGQVT